VTKTARKPLHPATKAPPNGGRRIQTRRSGVHGKGVYAVADLAKGETLIEYVGEIIDWEEALRRHPHDPKDPNHTFYFHLDEDHVIDANVGGNSSRWINHSCKPNCKAEVKDGRVFIRTKKDIPAGDELFYDYGLVIDEPHTPELLSQYPCWCGSKKCRGTLLAPQEEATKATPKDLKGKSKDKNKGETRSKGKKARRA
jgi:uncharacterized protein